ncbi:mucin-2-like [Oncorhynchus clarkii lewisi]|uniref:mucin-2-like n=1 Tax=Oncorhynchus clarkii lewisi TaxID=490388 RepID=UPI0039B827F4
MQLISLHKVLSEPDGKQFQFPNANFIDDGTEITANVTYVYKEEDVNHPSGFLQEVLKVSGLLTTTVAPTTTTTTTTNTTPLPTLLTSVTSTTRFGTVGVFVKLIFKVKTPVPTEDDVLGAVKKQLSPQFKTTQTTFQNATYIKLTDTSFAIDLGFKITNVTQEFLSNRLTLTNETETQIQDSINRLLHKVLSEPDGKQFQFPNANFIDDGTEITANVTYVYKEEDVNHPSGFLQEVLKVSGLLTTTVAPTTTTNTTPLPTLLTSVTSTTRFGTVGVFVKLIFKVKTPVPTEDDVLGAVKKQLSPQFTTTQTTFQNATYIKLTDTSFAIDLGFKITNVTQEFLSNRLTLTNETETQIQDSINRLLHKVLSEPDGKQFQFPNANFIDDGTEITANVTYVYKEEDVNHPSGFLQEVLKVSGLLTTTVAPTTTTNTTPLPTLLTSVTSTTRFGTVGVFVKLIFKVKTPVPTEDDVLGAVKKQLSPQFTTTQTTFQNATYIKLTDTSFAIDLGFKITNVTQESLSNRLTLTNETETQIQDSINRLLHKVLSEPDGKQFQFPNANFIDDGTEITANVTYVYKEEDVNHPSGFLQEVLKVSGLLTTTVAPTTTTNTTPLPTLLTSVTSTTRFGTVGVFVKLIFKVKTPVPTEDDVLGAVKKQLSPQFTTTQTTFQNATYIKLTDTSFAIDLGFKITNVTQEFLSNRLTLTNETETQIQDSINRLLHKVLSEPDGKQFQFPNANFIDDGTEITANVTYVYKEEDVNHPSGFLQEVLKVSGLLTTTVAPTTTTNTTPLPTLLTSVTSTTRFGTVGVFVKLIFKVKTPVPTEDDVLGAVKKQLSPQFLTTQTTFQNATYIKLTDTSFAIDLGFKITNVTQEFLSNRLTLTNETETQIQDSINRLLHKVLSEPDGKQFQFPNANFIDDGTEITANVTYVYKEEDVNHPSGFLQEVLKVSGLLTTTVAPTTTTTTNTTPLPTLLTSVTSTTRFGTVGVFVKLIFKVKTPVPTEDDVLGAVKKQLSPQFTTTQTTFQNATYIKLTDTSFAIDLGFKITNVTQESLSNRLTLTNETETQIQDSINRLLHKVLSEPDGKQFQFPNANFIDDGTEITANVTYVYKEEDVNHPSGFLQEVLKVSGLLTTTVAPTTTTTTNTTPLPTLLTSVTSTTRFGTVGVFVKLIFKVKTPVPTEDDVLGAVKKQLSPQFTTTQTTFQNATYIKLTDTSFAIDLGFKITNVTQESLSNRLTLTNETETQIQDSINRLLHKVLSEPDGKQFQFPNANFIDDGTEITANVTYVYKEEDVNHPSGFLQEVLKVSGLLTTTVAPTTTTTTTTNTTPLPTLLTSVTSTTRFGTVGVFVKLIFKVKTPVPTEDDVLGAVKKQLSPQFTTTQTTFQNATYIKLTDTSFAIDLGFKITNVTQESLSNRLTLTNETETQIQDSINRLLHKVLSEPDGKQFQFPNANFIDDGTEITANVTSPDHHCCPPTTTTTTNTTPLPTLLTSVTSTTRFGTVGVFVKLIFKVKTPVPTEDDVLGAVKKQLSPQFTTTQTTFQNATYIKLTDTSFAIDLGFKITNVTQEFLSNRLTLTNETETQIQDSINRLLHKVLSEPDGKQFQFPNANFIDDGTEITANVTYVYKEEDVNHPSGFLQEVLKVSGLLTTTVAPTTTTNTTPLPTLLTSVTSTTRFGTVGVFVKLIFKVKTPVPTEDDVLGAVKKQLSPQFLTTQTTFQNATYIKLTDTSFAIDLGFKITNVTQEFLSNRLTLTNETETQIQDSINRLLHKVLSEPDGKQFQFPNANFIDDGTEITANVTYVYKEEDVNHPSGFLQEVLKVSGLLTTTVAPTTTTTTNTTPLPTLLTSVTSTTRFGTVGVFVKLIFKVKTPVPTEDDVLGAVKKQLSPQFTTTQTTFQNATYIKLTDTSFAIDLGFKITNVTQESLSNRLTLTNETETQIQDSINRLLHKVLSEPDGKQFQFPNANFIDDGTEITANVTYVYKDEDVNHPSGFLQEVLKVSGLLTPTVAPTTTTTTNTTPLPTLLTSVTSTTRFGTVGVFVKLIFKVKTPVPTEDDVLGAVKKQLSPQFTTTQTTFQNATYIKLTDTSFAIDLGFKITNVTQESLSNRLTLTNETETQIQDSINRLLHKVLSEPDGKQFQFPNANFIDDGTEITANVTYVYKEEDVNHPSGFLQEVLKVSGLLTTTVAPTTTTTTNTTPLPTLLTSVTSTTRFGTVGVFVKLIFKVKTPVPTEDDVLGAVKKQLSPQFTTTQTTFQNATYIKLTDTSFAIDLGFKITNVTQESLSNRLTLTNETETQIQDSINRLLHKVLSEPDGKQFQFPNANFIDDGTEITANVTYVYKEEDVNHPSGFLQEVLKVSGLLTPTVAPTTTTTTNTTPLPTLLTSVTSTTRFGTVGVFVKLIFKVKTPVPTEDDVLGAVKKQLSPQFTTTQTTFQNATYIKLTDTSFAIDLGFKITNVTQESLSNRLTLTNETETQIQDSINRLLHKVLSEPDGKQFQFPNANFIDDGTEITANVTYVYKEEDVNHPSGFLQEVLKVSGLLTPTVAPTTTTTTNTTPLPTLLTSVTSTTRFGTVGVFVKLIFKVKTPVPTEDDVLGAVKKQLSPQFTTTQTTFQNATYIKLTDTSFAIDLGFKITNVTQESLSNRLTLTNETETQIQDSINRLLHKVLSEPDGKQFQFPNANFIDDGTEITANVTYVYKEEDVNHPSGFLQEVLKVSGLLTPTVAPTTTTTTNTTPLPTLLTSVTSTTRFGTVGVFVKLIFKVKTPVPTEDDVLGAVKKQLSPQFTTTQTTFQNATYIKLTDTSFAIDLGFKITNVTQESLSNRLTLTNETETQIQDSINRLLHKVLSEPDGKQFQFPNANFIDDGTEITANVTYVYKEEDVNHPSGFLQEVLKVSGLLTPTVAPTTTTTTNTTPLPTLLTSVTSTTRFGTVGVFVKLIFKVKTPVPTEDDVLGAVKKQLSPQFTTTQTTFQNATYIKLTDTSFAIDLGFKITNVTQESLSNRLTLTNETETQIQDSINRLLHKVLSEPDGKQFQFPNANFIDDGTEITANVTYVYKEEDVNHPSGFLQEVLKVSGLLTPTVAPTTTTTTNTTPLPTLLTSVTSTTRFGTVGVFVKLIFKVKTPVPTEDDVLGAVKKQLSPQFTTTQTTFQNATYIKLTDTSFAIDLGFKITNVTQESLSNRLTLTNETETQIQDSINRLLHKVLSEPDGKQFQFPNANFIDDGTEITANVTYVYKEEDVNHPSGFLQEVLKVSGLLTPTVAPTTTTTTNTTPLPTLLTSVTSTTRFGTVGVFVKLIFKVKTPVPTEDDVLGAVKKQLSPQFTTTQTTFQNATYIKLTDTSFAIDLGFKITNVTQESLSNRLTLTNETETQIQDSINRLLHKVLSEPDGKQFQFPNANFIDDGTEITANVTYVYKEEDVNHPSGFLQEVLKVSGLLTPTVAPTTTTTTNTTPLPTLLTSVTSTTRFGTVGVFVKLIFKVKTPVPTEDDVLGAVKKQLSPQFTTTQTTFQNATYIKLTDTSFAIDLGFKITNVTQESLSNRLTLTNETETQIQDSINRLLHKVLSEPDGKQFQFPNANFIDDGTEITANVTYVYKEEDVNHPSGFLQEVLKVSGLLTPTVAPTTTTTTNTTPLPTLLTSVTSTTSSVKVLSEPDGKQFQFPNANFIDDGTEITANVTSPDHHCCPNNNNNYQHHTISYPFDFSDINN